MLISRIRRSLKSGAGSWHPDVPRRKTIKVVDLGTRLVPDLTNILSSRGWECTHRFEQLARDVWIVDDALLAVVRTTVQPPTTRIAVLAHGPSRRAIISYPYNPSLDLPMKKLGHISLGMEWPVHGRVVRIETSAAAEKLARYLLRHFDALVVDDGGHVFLMFL